jgi:hypothetical protein
LREVVQLAVIAATILALSAVIAAAMGGPAPVAYPLTAREVDRMPVGRAVALANCQERKVAQDKGQAAAEKYLSDEFDKVVDSTKEDYPPLQVALARDGYTCSDEEIAAFNTGD